MKDIIITSQKIKRERNIYLICFLLSFAINIIAILVYTRPTGVCARYQFFHLFHTMDSAYTHYRVTPSPSKKEVTALRFLKID